MFLSKGARKLKINGWDNIKYIAGDPMTIDEALRKITYCIENINQHKTGTIDFLFRVRATPVSRLSIIGNSKRNIETVSPGQQRAIENIYSEID